jgi:hypothetical protein
LAFRMGSGQFRPRVSSSFWACIADPWVLRGF